MFVDFDFDVPLHKVRPVRHQGSADPAEPCIFLLYFYRRYMFRTDSFMWFDEPFQSPTIRYSLIGVLVFFAKTPCTGVAVRSVPLPYTRLREPSFVRIVGPCIVQAKE